MSLFKETVEFKVKEQLNSPVNIKIAAKNPLTEEELLNFKNKFKEVLGQDVNLVVTYK